jgi:8-oxo-dGTP pyrophosphatase MutT (NUDIX family)
MLHLITRLLPPSLHRLALPLAHAIRIVWWRVRRPVVVGCRVLAVNPQGEVLLVRHSYGSSQWMLPGGGVARGEAPIVAAVRELAEETACTLTHPVELTVTRRQWQGTAHVQHVIAGRIDDTPHADGREIVAAQCFALGALPGDISRSLMVNLPIWVELLG